MAHKTVKVLPRDDGVDFQQSWKTTVDGKPEGSHTTKRAAENAARRVANVGDTLVIYRQDGTVQSRSTVQGSSSSSGSDGGAGMPWGKKWAGDHASEATGIDLFRD